MSTFDIPGLVLNHISELAPMHAERGLIKPETSLTGDPLYLDEMDVMDLVWMVEYDLGIAVPFSEEEKLYATGVTIQQAIDLFTKLYNEQHPNPQ